MKELSKIANWKEMINEVILGDCLEGMKLIPDKSIDLVYADPPFNTGGNIGWYNRDYGEGSNDKLSLEDYVAFCHTWFTEARRISKRIVLTPGVGNIGHYPNPLWCIVIDKPSSPSFNRMGGFNCWEPLFIYDKPTGRLPRDVVRFDSQNFIKDGREKHPCPDNHNMVEWIILNWSNEGELVLDPFMGSGTTARSCKNLGRQWAGFEIQPDFIQICEKRLQQENLF